MPTKENENEHKDAQAREADAEKAAGAEKANAAEGLDFANMDLSVESVEERISPSETNVFDK